ncbi:VacJ family lipoprotein [Desulfobulbus rhabdoformis]|uniref:MlaA family lipoprotein n=1 Tax=Desulfobulbus rhabdoformis TaxID=34032 RepID=UPI0019629089|nr:VacJ family lipoprotein [Desulfobulbus rhabdoformis]
MAVLLLNATPVLAVDLLDDASYESVPGEMVADPIEPLNRAFFAFNDTFYLWVLDPVASGYSMILPEDIRGCVDNFFYNLAEPVRAVNCLLQGRISDSGIVLTRFVINSVFGVFGLADAAAHEFKLDPVHAAFGETLAVWGVGDGLYLVVPFFGPSTARDFLGVGVDTFAMTTYYPWRDDDMTLVSLAIAQRVNTTSLHLGEYQDMKSMSFDPYIAFRSGYFQMRSKRRQHGQPVDEAQLGN